MFFVGVGFVFASYLSIRYYEKKHSTTTSKMDHQKEFWLVEDKSLAEKVQVDKKARDTNLHYLKAGGLTLGLSILTRFHPMLMPVTLVSFTYTVIPYLRIIENSLLNNKKIDGYVLYGIADLMTLGLGRVATASFAINLVHLAHFIISNAEESSKKSLITVFSQQSRTAWVLRDGVELEVLLAEISVGDIVVVSTGEVIPVDGIVVYGVAAVDQHMLTGESQPAEKTQGDSVFASTLLIAGRIQVEVTQSGEETSVAKIAEILKHSIDFKTNTQLQGEKWADSWNLPILGLALGSMPFLGPTATVVILNGHIAQNIRVVAPLSTLNYLNIASRKGILVKDGRVLEDLHNIDVFLFDKTGTLTHEEPEVGRILSYLEGYSPDAILAYAAAAERKLAHPIARAIVNKAQELQLVLSTPEDSSYQIGYGVSVRIDDKLIQVGSRRFLQQAGIDFPADLDDTLHDFYATGSTVILLGIDDDFAGVIELCATVRPEIVEVLRKLRQQGASMLAIVSGDHQQPTQNLAKKLNMDHCFYDVLPQNKADIVEQLQKQGRTVCFIGDGVNDAIAMKKANISISLRGATSIATDTAQVVLMDGSLRHLPELLEISRDLNKNLSRGWVFNIIPGTVIIIGGILLHFSIVAAISISQIGLGLGVTNALLPLYRVKRDVAHGEKNILHAKDDDKTQ